MFLHFKGSAIFWGSRADVRENLKKMMTECDFAAFTVWRIISISSGMGQ